MAWKRSPVQVRYGPPTSKTSLLQGGLCFLGFLCYSCSESSTISMFKDHKRSEPRIRINHQIKVPEVTVIDDKGQNLGVMATHKALELAQQQELDLVEVGPSAKPPIVKILDYGKYSYQKEKRERENKAQIKNQE